MGKYVLIKFYDDNLAGYSWKLEFYLTQIKDKTYSVCCKQTVSEPPAMRIPGYYKLKTGSQIRTVLNNLVQEAGYSMPDNIEEIAKKIEVLNPTLASEFLTVG